MKNEHKQSLHLQHKILFTGGHAATPALGIVEEIRKRKLPWLLYWVGPVSAMESGTVSTAGEKVLTNYDVKIRKIVAGRALRRGSIFTILRAYLKIPVGFLQAFRVVREINPDLVISHGGFAAVPIVVNAWLMGKKVIIQEQIVGAGLANKLSAPFATKIYVSRSESLDFFPKQKTVLIGNPQVSSFFSVKTRLKMNNPAVIFITGGSSGAEIINTNIDLILEKLLTDCKVIHQTGERNISHFLERREKLDGELKKRYEVFGYANPQEFSKYFDESDIIISRAGANTVSDIVVSKRPAILIPIPWSIGDEQRKNARKAVGAGIAVILEQDNMTPQTLLGKIESVKQNWSTMIQNVKMGDYALDKDASRKFVDEIVKLLEL